MALNNKNLERLNALLNAFDSGAVQHDELIKAIDAVVNIINKEKEALSGSIENTSDELVGALKETHKNLDTKISSLNALVEKLTNSTTQANNKVSTSLSKEIKRVEAKIPSKTDLSGIEQAIEDVRRGLVDVPTEITANPKAVRDSLELLTGEERLERSAISGLDDYEEVSKLAREKVKGGRAKGWASSFASLEAGTGISIDKSDPRRPVITATGGGGSVSDDAYDASWDGDTTTAPSKNAVYDKIETLPGGHDPVTVTDSSEIDFTLTGQDITAVLKAGSIDESKLDTSVNASLDLADSAQQPPSEGAFVDGDKTKLDGIEAGADVTDTTNVTSAGALMDSEVTNLAQVKAFNSSDYATAAQGATADSALQPSDIASGTITPRADDIDLSGGSDGDVLTVQADGSLALETPSGGSGNTFNDIYIDQSGGTSDTYGVLAGTINGSNKVFTVSEGEYATGTLKVWLNGQLQTQGSGEDFVETTPASGTFTLGVAPESGDEITAEYQLVVTNSNTLVSTTTERFEMTVAISDETTDLTTGTAKLTFRMPRAVTLTAVRASVTTAPTGANLVIGINEGGSTILSTDLSIDAGEKTSTTATTPVVISDTSIADDAEITIDIDQIGSSVAGAGAKVTFLGTYT